MNTDAQHPTTQDLTLISQVARDAARSHRLSATDAQDFVQSVHVRFLERDYDVLRQFAGRCTLRSYLRVVIGRLMLDWLNATYGKWRPSAAAQRLGATALALERLIVRDGHSVSDAVAQLAHTTPERTPDSLRALAATLPPRVRRRFVPEDVLEWDGHTAFLDPVADAEHEREQRSVRRALRDALRELPADERHLLERRYQQRQSVQKLGQELGVDPKLLYRRFERSLRTLRRSLNRMGVNAAPPAAQRKAAAC